MRDFTARGYRQHDTLVVTLRERVPVTPLEQLYSWAVGSYRRRPNCRWSKSAEIPRLSVVMRYAAQNHTVNGIFVL